MISEALEHAVSQENKSILAVEVFSPHNIEKFLQQEYDSCMQSWLDYNSRRKAGDKRELYMTSEEARDSITRLAPLRLVDGAWLAHVNKISTSTALRKATRFAWQILSKELGDGELKKNHVNVYRNLVSAASGELLEPHSLSFIGPHHQMDDSNVWKAAVAQQLISLLPERFMPELLGFNLHFEAISFETLVTSRELGELGYPPLYYLLHISIDNPHSGYTAMALEAVIEYLASVERNSGTKELNIAWNRVRAGCVLSEYLMASIAQRQNAPDTTPFGEAMVRIISGKARAGRKMHCRSRIKIGGNQIDHWLQEGHLLDQESRKEFLRALSNPSGLVHKGCSAESRLVKEVSWGGKMFGSFTGAEVSVVKQWIDAQHPDCTTAYWTFTGLCMDEANYHPQLERRCWANAFYTQAPLIKKNSAGP
ncbi:MAG: hypothetical protein M1829_006576 [Trizodia sp. TS-e1964]|nr:MAG: hypothetical protein M1829_006576 [Trizodia sp. TS-e1964]